MRLILLGTAGLIPTDKAQTACFILPEVGVLLDAGSGLYRMNRYLQTSELDVYLSHAHGDHTSGLIYLFASFFVNEINRSKVTVDETNIGEILVHRNPIEQWSIDADLDTARAAFPSIEIGVDGMEIDF
jgi:ribonuclease Z